MTRAAAAYFLGNAQGFKDITKALVLDCFGPYYFAGNDEVQSVLPWKVFSMLEEQRGLARLQLANILIAGGGANSFAGKRVPLAEKPFPQLYLKRIDEGRRDARSSSPGAKQSMFYGPVAYGPTIQTTPDFRTPHF